jgi:hypothetical protein
MSGSEHRRSGAPVRRATRATDSHCRRSIIDIIAERGRVGAAPMKRFFIALSLVLSGCIIQLPPESNLRSTRTVEPAAEPPPAAQTVAPVAPPLPPPVAVAPPSAAPAPAPIPVAQPAPVVVMAPPPPVVIVEHPPLPDAEIVVVYEDLLGRRPSERELWQWRDRTRHVVMSRDDVRGELRASGEYRSLAPETIIRRAFRDFHGREPAVDEMRYFRRRIIDDDWSAGQVRQSVAHRERRNDSRGSADNHDRRGDRDRGSSRGQFAEERDAHSPDAIIERAYDDLLEREPDAEGRDRYRRFLQRGESEKQIRARIKQSLEYRVILPDSKTKRAYLEVLGREADPVGLEGYRHRIVDDGWTEEDVKNSLRQTAEFRNRKR